MANLNNGLTTIETGQQDARAKINANFSLLDKYRFRSGALSARPTGVGAYDGQLYLATSFGVDAKGAAFYYWDGSNWVAIYSAKLRTDTGSATAMEYDDAVVLLDATTITLNFTLLPADTGLRAPGVPLTIKRIDASGSNSCNINRAADRQIDGVGTGAYSLASQYDSVTLVSNGVDEYHIVSEVVN